MSPPDASSARGDVAEARPAIDPGLLAALIEEAPARLRRKVEAEPDLADTWSWSAAGDGWTVVAGDETVTLRPGPSGVVGTVGADGIACSCLLSPRCRHVLAVAMACPVAGEERGEVDAAAPAVDVAVEEAPDDGPALDADQRRAAAAAWAAHASTLAAGIAGVGALDLATLLRAAHDARRAGLHRLSAATVRTVTQIRAHAGSASDFDLGRYAADQAEALAVAWRLLHGDASVAARRADIGRARRAYREVGALHLGGLFTEPVVTATGYAGAVTVFVDDDGRLWSSGSVVPGAPDQARRAALGPIGLGGLNVDHRHAGRLELFVSGATASDDGRLGSGAGVRATVGQASTWDHPAIAARFATPFDDQLDALWARDVGEPTDPGRGLVFLTAVLDGPAAGGVALRLVDPARPRVLVGTPASLAPLLAFHDNVRFLIGERGLVVRLVGRIDERRTGEVALLALAGTDGPALALPPGWQGRVDLGIDQLAGAHRAAPPGDLGTVPGAPPGDLGTVPGAPPGDLGTVPGAPARSAALGVLERVLHRVAAGGRATLAAGATERLERDRRRLRQGALTTAAELLGALRAAAVETRRSITGEPYAPPPDDLARAWVAAMAYLDGASRARTRAQW